jgi:hypothetical protein
MHLRFLLAASVAAGLAIPHAAMAQQDDGTEVQFPVNVFKLNKLQPTADRLARIKAPDGFKVEPFAGHQSFLWNNIENLL